MIPAAGGGIPDTTLFLDAGLADLDSLAIASRQRALDAVGAAATSVNERALAGELDERELACLDGEYPYLAWFCGNDGDGVPVVTERFEIRAYDHLPDDACGQAIAGGMAAGGACRPTFAELDAVDGSVARYRVRLVEGRVRETLALASDVDDLEIDAIGTDGASSTCRITFDLDAGDAPLFDDPVVCEERLRGFLAES